MISKKRLWNFAFLGFCVGAIAASSWCEERVIHASGTVKGKYVRESAEGVKVMQSWYREEMGLYAAPADWWNAANAITVLANYERVSGERQYDAVFANTFTAAQKTSANFVNRYYDDDGWWALAWIDAYDVTGETEYLSMAETVFAEMTGAWDTATCGGGAWWSKDRKYKNAIANELFLSVAAALANRTMGAKSAEYRIWARREWQWFKATGMINAQSLVNDGLNSADPNACVNNGRRAWSYNQGVVLGGLVELYKADKDRALLTRAMAIADAAIAQLVNTDGVLAEPVGGKDAPQFKGVFLRNLMALSKVAPRARRAQYQKFAEANAASILANDAGPGGQFGAQWQGPFDSGDATRQASALDALLAAAAMQ